MSGSNDYSRRDATSREEYTRDDDRQRHSFRNERNYSRDDRMSGGNDYRRRDATSREDYTRDDDRQRYGFRNERNYSRADRDQNWRRTSDNVSTSNQATNYDPILKILDNANRNNASRPSDDTIRYFIPRYNEIMEDKSIMANYRKNIRYVGDYSDDEDGKYSQEHIGFRFLKPEFRPDDRTKVKEVKFDLTVASDRAEEFTKRGHFDGYLKCIQQEPEVLSSLKSDPDGKSEVKFLMTYFTLTKILQMPYVLNHLDKDIPLGACLKSGVIYMYSASQPRTNIILDLNQTDSDNESDTTEEPNETNKPDIRDEKNPASNKWGHKFKQFMCNEDVTKGIIPNEAFRIVVSSKLGPYDVLVNSVTDCLNPKLYKGERDLSAFVRLYMTRCSANTINKRKSYEWVVPMIVGGTEEMIAGFSNHDGIVSEVRSYTVDDLLARGKGHWNLDKHFTFAVDFLDFVKELTSLAPGVNIFFLRKAGESFLTCQDSFSMNVIEKGETDPKPTKMECEFTYNWFSDAVKNA